MGKSQVVEAMLYLLSVFCLVSCASANFFGLWGCPPVKALTSFNADQFSGKWYTVRESDEFLNRMGKCNSFSFTKTGAQVMEISANQKIAGIMTVKASADASLPKPTGSAKLTVTVGLLSMDYEVLGTDYKSWAVVYGCKDFLLFHVRWTAILTKDRHPEQRTLDSANQILTDNHLNFLALLKTDQEDCS